MSMSMAGSLTNQAGSHGQLGDNTQSTVSNFLIDILARNKQS